MRLELKSLAILVAVAALGVGCDNTSLLSGPGQPLVTTTGSGDTGSTLLVVSASSAVVAATTPVAISVSATANNAPVANDTQVTFSTNFGSFTDSSSPTTVQRTTNGLAAANITSRTAGIATVSATIGGVSKSVTVTFTAPPG